MQFSNTTDKNGLIQHAEQTLWGDNPFGTITNDPEKFAIFRNLMDRAMDDYTNLALLNDFRWTYDDYNHTDYPVGEGRLVANQQDYPIPLEYMFIEQVELKTQENVWIRLVPFDLSETRNNSRGISEGLPWGNEVGIPRFYRKLGQSLLLYPTPNWSDSGDNETGPRSLRVHYKRPSTYFDIDTPEKEVGIPAVHAPYIYLSACATYAEDKTMESAQGLRNKVLMYEERKIPTFFGKRSQDRTKIMRALRTHAH
jgi:hypothetical protein